MREDMAVLNPTELEDAPCGCKRYEIDSIGGTGRNGVDAPTRGRICLHDDDCADKQPKARGKK